MSDRHSSGLPRELPLVGRRDDLESLYTLFGDERVVEPFVVLTGETGVGKSRLARTLAHEAERRGWAVAAGRAYPVETGVPYALMSDALLPVVRGMDDATLTVLTRGTEDELRRLFPALGPVEKPAHAGADPRELRTRLFWNLTEFLKNLAGRAPLLLILEDLHWADASSLALLHFVTRQIEGEPIRVLGTYNTDYRQGNDRLLRMERSLVALRNLRLHPLHPLTRHGTESLLEQSFEVSGPHVREFASLLYGWTRGNPYFIEQTLDALVESGRLFRRDGAWLGWEARELELPGTVRDAVILRLSGLSDAAVGLAEGLAVVGTRARLSLLERCTDLSGDSFTDAVEALVASGLLDERDEEGSLYLEFRHPLVRETLYQRLSLTRLRHLHRRVAEEMERLYGDAALEHADELAYQFTHAGEPQEEPRAARYLVAAGRSALERHADREAADYLEAALARLPGDGADDGHGRPDDVPGVEAIRIDLARAHSRLGHYDQAGELWRSVLAARREDGGAPLAQAHRHLALLEFWSGRHEGAIREFDEALRALGTGGPALEARLQLAAGVAFQELGRPDDALQRIEGALELAEALDEPMLLGRVHRALALLFTWIGQPERARKHGWKAVTLARESGDLHVEFWGRWALAALEGLTGDTESMARLLDEARSAAEDLGSPVLRLWVAELSVEYAYATGDWEGGLAQGERGISLATALNQRTVLVRLLVWTAMIYLGRGSYERAQDLVDRAWELSGAEHADEGPMDVHAVVPAHIGRAAVQMFRGDIEDAARTAEAGLRLAEQSGYVIWILHRLLPILGEASIRLEDMDKAHAVGRRMRREADQINHTLGIAWADACDALVAWHSGRPAEAAGLMRSAAEGLEEIPILPDAARLRRQLAGCLADLGEREAALTELRRVHDVFGQLGATPELEKAREQFRNLGSRPPSRSQAEGTAELTPREVEIARLVADRRSSKAIARELDISPRTVTTHLSNIYRKLDIGSRGELADMVREARLPLDEVDPTGGAGA